MISRIKGILQTCDIIVLNMLFDVTSPLRLLSYFRKVPNE